MEPQAIPYYESGKPPRYYQYHEEVDFLDELKNLG